MPVYIILSDESSIRVQLAHIYTVLLLTLFPFFVQILNSRPGKTSFRSASGFYFIFFVHFLQESEQSCVITNLTILTINQGI